MTNQEQYAGGLMENYKGIMICSRPQDQINLDFPRPFISRVHQDEPLGYNPITKIVVQKAVKVPKPVLRKHQQWLSNYSQKMKLKYSGQTDIQNSVVKTKSEVKSQSNQPPLQQQSQIVESEQKVIFSIIFYYFIQPAWALSETKQKEKEDQEIDELIDFTKSLNFDEYINDLEVKIMLEALKTRVNEIQNNKEEKQALIDKVNSKQDGTQKSQSVKKITKFLDQHQQQTKEDWDRSVHDETKQLTVEERLAKHIAEEILKNNKYLRGLHSKLSLQRIIEMEAQKQLKEIPPQQLLK